QRWTPGSHGGTFGGNVVSAAAAVATLRAMRQEGMLANAAERGVQLVAGLHHLQQGSAPISDVRGLGLMVACEIRTPQGKPDKETAKKLVHACLDRKLLLLTCGPWDNTIRWMPPLVVTPDEIEQALVIFAAALDEVAG
ncbi:MAG: aminotransferase class III-fold pyridoxal phosphate-dependent enzyme, partial [Anaerolineales bacterium]|nr:aminotransferase class III-fold pyridoxal phosphate-dependent enzyme [Anaerolineales bacterium]